MQIAWTETCKRKLTRKPPVEPVLLEAQIDLRGLDYTTIHPSPYDNGISNTDIVIGLDDETGTPRVFEVRLVSKEAEKRLPDLLSLSGNLRTRQRSRAENDRIGIMVFKDRKEAGEKLAEAVKKDKKLISGIDDAVIVSLLRGGIIIGNILAKKLSIPHYPLIVAKIPAPPPHSPELAIGAICGDGDTVYINKRILSSIASLNTDISGQVKQARKKQKKYLKRFKLENINYMAKLKNKIVFLVDDGIATGSTIRAAALFIKKKKAKKIILSVPVAPAEFKPYGFDKAIILRKEQDFFAVGQFYKKFEEVNENVY